MGDLTAEAELQSALALLAAYRADWDEVAALPRPAWSWPSARGWPAAWPTRTRCAGCCAGASGDFAAAEAYRRALAIAEETGWSEVAYWALYGLALTLRDSGDLPGALRRWTRRWRCASARGWWPSRSRPPGARGR